MQAAFIAALTCLLSGPTTDTQATKPQIEVGWSDELNGSFKWAALNAENKAKINVPKPGAVRLSLAKVPEGWPYEYQWSGVQRDIQVDVARFPVLSAAVVDVYGYAHLDIEVLDATGKPVKNIRSSTLTSAGIATYDFSKDLDPAVYRLRLRLIVGGPNAGCDATYQWIRFTSATDATFLAKNPTWQRIRAAKPKGS